MPDRELVPSEQQIVEMYQKIQQNAAEDAAFSEELDIFLQAERTTENLLVGLTSNVLALSGANPDLNVVISPRTIIKVMSEPDEHYHGHGLSADIVKKIPQELRSPIMVFKGNRDNSLVVITELRDNEQRDIMIAVSLNEINNHHEVNRIASMYGRNNMANYINAQIRPVRKP